MAKSLYPVLCPFCTERFLTPLWDAVNAGMDTEAIELIEGATVQGTDLDTYQSPSSPEEEVTEEQD